MHRTGALKIRFMKKTIIFISTLVLGVSATLACNIHSTASCVSTAVLYSSNISVPTGVFFNGQDFIKVERGWLRIKIGGSMIEDDYTAEKDPQGNYVLKMEKGGCITMAPNGRDLWYDGVKYSKLSY